MAARAADPTNFTLRGILVGLIIGVFINFSNIYFGLQTGWISGMSMPSALISFGFFKAMSPYLKVQFSPVENVLVQSVAGSVGTMPLGCGFVGVIPALEFLLKPEEGGPLHFAFWKLALWAVGICLFGVVFAVPLRKQVLIKEKLPFPSGAATALVIGVLHGDKSESTVIKQDNMDQDDEGHDGSHDVNIPQAASNAELLEALQPNPSRGGSMDWRGKIKLLTWAFFGSAIYVGNAIAIAASKAYASPDRLYVFRSTSPQRPNLRQLPGEYLAMDFESIARLCRSRYNHGPVNHHPHVPRSNLRLGCAVTSCQASRMGTRLRRRLEYRQQRLDRLGQSRDYACRFTGVARLAYFTTTHCLWPALLTGSLDASSKKAMESTLP